MSENYKAVYKFDNGYGVSIVRNEISYGGKEGLFELAVLDENGEITYDTEITDDVVGYLTSAQALILAMKVAALKK
jgi:hypothetical protein